MVLDDDDFFSNFFGHLKFCPSFPEIWRVGRVVTMAWFLKIPHLCHHFLGPHCRVFDCELYFNIFNFPRNIHHWKIVPQNCWLQNPCKTMIFFGKSIRWEWQFKLKRWNVPNHRVFLEAAGLCAQNWVPWQKKSQHVCEHGGCNPLHSWKWCIYI